MKWLRNILDKVEPDFKSGGRFESLAPIFEATDTILFSTDERTESGPHIRDSVDIKRVMILVVLSLIPCYVFGAINIGYQKSLTYGLETTWVENLITGLLTIVPIIAVTFMSGAFWELLFGVVRKHPISEGFLVTCALIPLTLPPAIPLWQVAVATSFGIVIGKEIFGGVGMNIFNPALLARAFAFFAYPTYMSGDKVWINTTGTEGMMAVDGFSGATALGEYATTGVSQYSALDAFIGIIPGSVGETSVIAIMLGAGLLLFTGIASWRIMLSAVLGGVVMGLIFNAVAPLALSAEQQAFMAVPFWQQLVMGGFAFGVVYMATDPVSGSQTETGKYVYGFLIGFLSIMIRVFNPAYPEGVMLAILFMNTMAPLVDHYVIQANIKKREQRLALKTAV